MAKGPRGEKRLAGVIGGAIMAAKIATGKIVRDVALACRRRAWEQGRQGAGGSPVQAAAIRDCPEGREQSMKKR